MNQEPEAYDRPQTTQGYPFNTEPERPQDPTVVEQIPRQMSFPGLAQPPPGMTAFLAVMKERMIAKKKAEGRYREPVMIVDGKEYVFYTDKDGRTNFRINETAWSASEPIGDESDRRGGSEAESGTSGSGTADSESADGGSSPRSGDDTPPS